MFMHKSKKGFTIVELVIVIAVIAILAAVLIPTFSNLVKKANMSADQQAVRQMNTVLAAEGAVEKNTIFEVYDALAANGMTAKDYTPLTTDHYFFWDDEADRIVYTDKNYQVIYPADFEKAADANWFSLNQELQTTPVTPTTVEGVTTYKVSTGEEMAYVVEQLQGDNINEAIVIDLGGNTIDMMGAELNIHGNDWYQDISTPTINKNVTLRNGTIKNVSAMTAAYGTGEEGHDGVYSVGGIFGTVGKDATVTITGVDFVNINVCNTHASGVALLVASNDGIVNISDVTITSSTVIGHRNTGALVGQSNGSYKDKDGVNLGRVELGEDIVLNDVHVKTVGGRSGMLAGNVNAGAKPNFKAPHKITLTNCTYGIHSCEQNTGKWTFNGNSYDLGLQSDKKLNSYAWNNTNNQNEPEDKTYLANALAMSDRADASSLFTSVDGWNN